MGPRYPGDINRIECSNQWTMRSIIRYDSINVDTSSLRAKLESCSFIVHHATCARKERLSQSARCLILRHPPTPIDRRAHPASHFSVPGPGAMHTSSTKAPIYATRRTNLDRRAEMRSPFPQPSNPTRGVAPRRQCHHNSVEPIFTRPFPTSLVLRRVLCLTFQPHSREGLRDVHSGGLDPRLDLK